MKFQCTATNAVYAALFLAGAVFAQTSTGSITGTVVDPQQASIPAANVTARDLSKGTVYRSKTDNRGNFAFSSLPPSKYNIAIEAPNFKKLDINDQVLNANDKVSLGELALQIGSTTQTVEVQAQNAELQSASAERSNAIVGVQLQNTLVNSRSYLDLTKLVPGVVSTVNLQTAGHGGVGSISANGARTNQNNLTLNGLGNVDTGNNGDQLATVSLDSIQEYKILTSNYQAEYGRSSGAQISVVTKSGTNQFHGSGYWFHRHDSLNANNWKNNRDGLARKLFRFNDQGFTIGGPVYIPKIETKTKDKLFFFVSQEYQRQLKPNGEQDRTVPTTLERAGDFSSSVDKNGNPFPYIRDYTTGLPCNAANVTGCFAAGGVLGRIPQSRLYAPSLAILGIYPQPNAPGFLQSGYNFRSQVSDSYPRREDLVRLDYNITQNQHLFGHFIYNKDAITSVYGSFVLGSTIPLAPITDARPGKSFAVSHTWTLNPTLTNEATFGFSHNQINIDPSTTGALSRKTLGLTALPVLYPSAIQQDYIPTFGFNGTRISNTASFGTNNAPFFNYNTTIEWIDNVSKVWNAHILKAGVYIQRSRKDQTSFANANGSYDFSDNSSNPYDSGYGFANAALGVYNSFNQASAYLTGKYRYTNAEFYAQDTWKISRRLTLDYGIRFQYIQPQFDADQQTSTFLFDQYDPKQAVKLYQPGFDASGVKVAINPVNGSAGDVTNIGKIVTGSGNITDGVFLAGKGVNKYLMQNRGLHYAPRFGFAWDVTGKSNLVFRAGGGIFYDRYQGNNVFDEITNPPSAFSPTLVNGLVSGINPANVTLAPSSLTTFAYDGHVPTVYNYSASIQYKLPYEFVLDTAYVGSQGRHELVKKNYNAIPYGTTFAAQNQDPTKVKSNPTALLGANAYDANFVRPYTGYGDISVHEFGGSHNYNSLQVSLNKRFSKGLFFGLAYTWSKVLGVTSGDGDFIRIDNLTRFANYGPLSFDRRQTLVFNYVYDLPKMTNANALARQVVNGWQVSGVTTFQSGSPLGVGFSVPGYNNQLLTGSYTEGARIQVVGSGSPNTGSDSPFYRINGAIFGPPQVGNRGLGAGVNYLTNPGIGNWDISLQKMFYVKEKLSFQFRADAFNALNHTQFSGLNNTINFSGLTNPIITNAALDSTGKVINKNGFGSVSGARDPRIMQLVIRVVF